MHRGPWLDVSRPLKGPSSAHTSPHLGRTRGVLGEQEEEPQRAEEGGRGLGKNL